MRPLSIYDWKTKKRLAYLQNAYNVTYTQQANVVWTASFKLPYSDEKNEYCSFFNLVEIWDVDSGGKDKYIGLFRIMPTISKIDETVSDVTYELEHAMSTLIDTVLAGYKEWGGTNLDTTDLIKQVLSKQYEQKWILGECDFKKKYTYTFEDTNLLDALYSITKPLISDYYWSFNTLDFPWRLSLKKPSKIPVLDIRYGKNISGITKTIDPQNISTRLWLYGKEIDGIRINISSVNNNKKYIDSLSGISEYGIIGTIINDHSFETPQALYDYGVGLLNKIDKPSIFYTIDLKIISDSANLNIGDTVRLVIDNDIDQNLIVQQITKNDVSGNSTDGSITIGKGMSDLGIIIKSFN